MSGPSASTPSNYWNQMPYTYGSGATTKNPYTTWSGQGTYMPQYHDGGWVKGLPNIKSNEQFAKLMEGEYVSTPQMIADFMGNAVPAIASAGKSSIGSFMPIYISGNVTEDNLKEIEKIANKAIEKLNKSMSDRGLVRNAVQFGF
jgi:hypothetical protein